MSDMPMSDMKVVRRRLSNVGMVALAIGLLSTLFHPGSLFITALVWGFSTGVGLAVLMMMERES